MSTGYNKESHAKWYSKPENKLKRLHYQRKYQAAHRIPGRQRKYQLWLKYRLTEAQYVLMLMKQGARCAICNEHVAFLKKRLVVDHDHRTDKVRGLLCDSCNLSLGHFQDSIELLQAAIEYLQDYKGEN